MGKVKVYEAELDRIRESLAYGVQNLMFAVEADAKREAPVRGGYRSFMSTKRGKAGQVLIGGTLRRSIHSTTYYKGKPIVGGTDENGNAKPDYSESGDGDIVGIVGTNCSYGAFVELGTVKMRERPFLTPAFDANAANAGDLINAGARRRLGR
jgi:HK97 gp10 family phage protein